LRSPPVNVKSACPFVALTMAASDATNAGEAFDVDHVRCKSFVVSPVRSAAVPPSVNCTRIVRGLAL